MSMFARSLKALTPLLATTALLVAASVAQAQDSSDSEITITKGEAVQITGVDDWLIGVFGPTDDIANLAYNWYPSCVYTTTGSFTIDVISQNGGSRLHLESGAGDSMDYDLFMYMRRNNGGYQIYPSGFVPGYTTPTTTVTNVRGSQQPGCIDTGGRNVWFAALVTPAAFNPAPAGIYQDLATIIVTPE